MVALHSQANVFLASYTQKSRERNCKKANKFWHWLISRPCICGRQLEVLMHIRHDYSCSMPHTHGITQ